VPAAKVFNWADVEGPKDLPYLNQHVFNGKYSYFGKLLTRKLTKIVNLPALRMPPFVFLSEREIADLVAYLKTL
jgi:cytochrome c1